MMTERYAYDRERDAIVALPDENDMTNEEIVAELNSMTRLLAAHDAAPADAVGEWVVEESNAAGRWLVMQPTNGGFDVFIAETASEKRARDIAAAHNTRPAPEGQRS